MEELKNAEENIYSLAIAILKNLKNVQITYFSLLLMKNMIWIIVISNLVISNEIAPHNDSALRFRIAVV